VDRTPTSTAGTTLDERDLEQHRVELASYCYRMLGSPFDAEDAVQESLLKAWRHADQYDAGRGNLRAWLYRITTNVCLDMLRGRQRRARAMELAPPAWPGPDIGEPLEAGRWVEPVPDSLVLPPTVGPETHVLRRESVRLAFVAALQHLPPRQRAVLLLRDVLAWHAAEVAALLDMSTTSVNSALQRARATMATRPGGSLVGDTDPAVDGDLLARYCAAFEAYDVDTLVSLMHEDATTSMPPYLWWLRGREHIRQSLLAPNPFCAGSRAVPVAASGSPAFGHYVPDTVGGHQAFALVVLVMEAGRIADVTTFLDADRLFPRFGLPLAMP
jgi:RNA polymerase sigma-70 factor, ECF subfamily